ncbi:hypothetical protein BD779DRAFT_1508865 [Infundibulicybe gibba]|nr:hypothetical protein BD779DRAFT_1508865 [Infundibulicybe gibba]
MHSGMGRLRERFLASHWMLWSSGATPSTMRSRISCFIQTNLISTLRHRVRAVASVVRTGRILGLILEAYFRSSARKMKERGCVCER